MAAAMAMRSGLYSHNTASSQTITTHHHHPNHIRIHFLQNGRFRRLGLRQAGASMATVDASRLRFSRKETICCALQESNGGGECASDVDGGEARSLFSQNGRFRRLGLCQAAVAMARVDASRLRFSRKKTASCALQENNGGGEEEPSDLSEPSQGLREKIEAFGEALSSGFPLWVAAACVAGMMKPTAFTWIQGQVQIVGLSITMLGMGMTMSLDDLKGALAMPKELVAGVLLQYTVMPTAGAVISRLFSLPANYAAGLILVACCPGGTASNVVTYLARGNVALSVLMTAASTFMAVVMTPMLTSKLVGQYVAVDAGSLFFSTLQVVLLPVTVGVLMAHYLPGLVRRVSPLAPSVAVVTVAAICAGAISQNASTIRQSGGQVLAAVVSLHVAGFFFGYLLSRVLGFEESTSRTISIEVGMQNSVLGVVLASRHFGSPLTAVPCAVSSVAHSIIGSALARFWRSQAAKLPTSDDAVVS